MQIENIHTGMVVQLKTLCEVSEAFDLSIEEIRNGADVGNFPLSSGARDMLGGVFQAEDVHPETNAVRIQGYLFDAGIILPLPEDFKGYSGFNVGDAVTFRYREDVKECDPDDIWYVDGMARLGGMRATIVGMKYFDDNLARVWLDSDEADLGSWSFNTAMLEHGAAPVEISPEVWSGIALAR